MLEHDVAEARAVAEQQQELRLVIGRLEDFATTVRDSLDQVAWDTRRTLIRTLVKRVEVDLDEIRVIFRLGPDSSGPERSAAVLPDHARGIEAKNQEALWIDLRGFCLKCTLFCTHFASADVGKPSGTLTISSHFRWQIATA